MFEKDRPYRAWEILPDTWCIDGLIANCFLLIGRERAMLVDAGMNRNDLHAFVRTITDLPVFVANTHGHFDHTGGNGYFDEVYMSAYAATEARTRGKTASIRWITRSGSSKRDTCSTWEEDTWRRSPFPATVPGASHIWIWTERSSSPETRSIRHRYC